MRKCKGGGGGGFGGVVAFLDTETALCLTLYNDDGHRIDKCDRMVLGYQPKRETLIENLEEMKTRVTYPL